jgi:hypothetical protein
MPPHDAASGMETGRIGARVYNVKQGVPGSIVHCPNGALACDQYRRVVPVESSLTRAGIFGGMVCAPARLRAKDWTVVDTPRHSPEAQQRAVIKIETEGAVDLRRQIPWSGRIDARKKAHSSMRE